MSALDDYLSRVKHLPPAPRILPELLQLLRRPDVDADKVGKDLSEAIWAHPNDTYKFCDVPKTGITVQRGPVSSSRNFLRFARTARSLPGALMVRGRQTCQRT